MAVATRGDAMIGTAVVIVGTVGYTMVVVGMTEGDGAEGEMKELLGEGDVVEYTGGSL